VLQPGCTQSDLPPAQVLAFCRQRLAGFKVPRYFAYRADLPKTPSGKVAKQALRDMGAAQRLGSFDAVDGIWR
jgi:crotonobetaine/carnitine-CoA ligase